jgi:hypothetical protein
MPAKCAASDEIPTDIDSGGEALSAADNGTHPSLDVRELVADEDTWRFTAERVLHRVHG